jgi:aminoglycoside phosphotransferase family enzyme
MASKQWGEIMGETGDGTGEAVSPEDVKAIEEYADALLASKDNLVDTREEALKVAAAHTRMEKGINSLSENWETWNQVMTDGSMKEQVQATAEMK